MLIISKPYLPPRKTEKSNAQIDTPELAAAIAGLLKGQAIDIECADYPAGRSMVHGVAHVARRLGKGSGKQFHARRLTGTSVQLTRSY